MINKKLKHVGIVLDGNRRFAKKAGLNFRKGYEIGAEKVEKLLEWMVELDIFELTLYCFSLENFSRPKEELNFLMKLFKSYFRKVKKDKRVEKEGIKLRFVGKREFFDEELQEIMNSLEVMTKNNKNHVVNFAFGYGGRQEIVNAVKRLRKSGEEISEESLQKNLWIGSDVDLVIRFGSEKRMSNFLLWQASYAEWIFLDKNWPEFERQDLVDCLDEFKKRSQRFGK